MNQTLIRIDGQEIFCREWLAAEPNGEVILLLHGVESHSEWFDDIAREFTLLGYAVFAYDRPGWGKSPGCSGDLASYEEELTRLDSLATSLRQRHSKLHLCGLSWGGLLACYASLRRGLFFDTISLICPGICPTADLPAIDKLMVAGRLLINDGTAKFPIPIDPDTFTSKADKTRYIKNDPLRNKSVTARFCFETMKMRRFCHEKTGLRTPPPTILLLADNDKIINNIATEKLFAKAQNLETHKLNGMEHSLIFECPKQCAELIDGHIRKHVQPLNPTKAVVLGAGAVGSMVGALLAKGGTPTTLIARKAHVDTVNNTGLQLDLAGGSASIRSNLCAVENASEISEPADLLIVSVKSFDTQSALQEAKNLVNDKTVILSLQNGVGNEAKIQELFPNNTILGGAICAYLDLAKPGQVVWSSDRGGLAVGLVCGDDYRARSIAQTLRSTGMEVIYTESAQRVKWSKLLLNTAFNALNAATGLSAAEILAHREYGQLAVEALREGLTVMKHKGIEPLDLPGYDVKKLGLLCKLPLVVVRKVLAKIVAKDTRTISSMQQDLRRGRGMTEIDEINGAIVNAAQSLGLAAPANRKLCAMLKNRLG